MTQDEIIEMAIEAGGSDVGGPGWTTWVGTQSTEFLERFAHLVAAKERESFFGQDKPAECAEGCLPNQICDYCQIVAPAREMIAKEREACAKVVDDWSDWHGGTELIAAVIRERGQA